MQGLTREEELASVVQAFLDLFEDEDQYSSDQVEALVERAEVALLRDDEFPTLGEGGDEDCS